MLPRPSHIDQMGEDHPTDRTCFISLVRNVGGLRCHQTWLGNPRTKCEFRWASLIHHGQVGLSQKNTWGLIMGERIFKVIFNIAKKWISRQQTFLRNVHVQAPIDSTILGGTELQSSSGRCFADLFSWRFFFQVFHPVLAS